MNRKTVFMLLIVGVVCLFQCQEAENIPVGITFIDKPRIDSETLKGLDSLDIDFQLRGKCYAASSQINAKKSNGEGGSINLPKSTQGKFSEEWFGLYLSENKLQKAYEKNIGHTLYLINTTNENIEFNAQDSRLHITTEVKSKLGIWTEITYLPSSWCGNSYHKITLGANEYWEFVLPVFTGNYKTKLRYKLKMDDQMINSNEIIAYINQEQMDVERKEGHQPLSIMDPYLD